MPFASSEFDHHEQVIFCHDEAADMFGIIAVHSTRLGPAAGGCRMQPYTSVDDALHDVLRLSRGMTYKNALAGLPLGGGKCVVIADPRSPAKTERLRAMARQVQRLRGGFWTAVDVGVSATDVDVMAEESDYLFTRASHHGDFLAANYTAAGGFHALRATVEHTLATDDLDGVRVALQGVGSTGRNLTRQLVENGAQVMVADVDQTAVDDAVRDYGVIAVAPDRIHSQDVDVFAPCALGGGLNDRTIPDIRAKAVCGVANNQLDRPDHGQQLLDRGIAYAPDFVVNAGGMIGTSPVIFAELDREASLEKIRGIHDVVAEILDRSTAEGRPSSDIAEEMAREHIRRHRT